MSIIMDILVPIKNLKSTGQVTLQERQTKNLSLSYSKDGNVEWGEEEEIKLLGTSPVITYCVNKGMCLVRAVDVI